MCNLLQGTTSQVMFSASVTLNQLGFFVSLNVQTFQEKMTYTNRDIWSHGVMVSTQDFESYHPISNIGGTFSYLLHI